MSFAGVLKLVDPSLSSAWSWLVAVARPNFEAVGSFALSFLEEIMGGLLEFDGSFLMEVSMVFLFWIAAPIAVGGCVVSLCRRRG